MGKLRNIPARLGRLSPRLTPKADAQGHRPEAARSWYKTARWEALRHATFHRDNFTCQMAACGRVTSRPICDHRDPHRGDPGLFWDPQNLQTLCKACHDGVKQRLERQRR